MNQQPPDFSPAPARAQVSVLIRTMGRATLGQAISSVRAQSFGDWEIILLNASGQPFDALAPLPEDARIRMVDPQRRVPRAEAANLLLDACRTEFAVFLDDDDWFLPDHLAKLAGALRRDASLVAAYSDVELLEDARGPGRRAVHTFATDFDADALQLQNYLPIHAVMFRMAAVYAQPPARFDEGMSLFEDWDFWVQLSRRGRFEHVPGVSAAYALDASQGSGHAAQGQARREMLESMARRQLARWTPADVVRLIERETRQQGLRNQRDQELAAERSRLADLQLSLDEMFQLVIATQAQVSHLESEAAKQAALAAQREALMALQQAELALLARVREDLLEQVRALRASTSWRITRPLRYAGRQARRAARAMRLALRVLRTAADELRRQGPRGFALRLPYYLRQRRVYLARLAGAPAGPSANPFAAGPARVRADTRLHPDIDDSVEPVGATVSVVIPAFNAGPEFEWLLRKLKAQKGVAGVEIVVVDSGSGDTTVAMARAAGARVIEIPQSEFSHSHSRNLGAEAATGDYVLFIVQDAYPVGDHWMNGMLRALRDPAHARLAAVSCSEFARSDSDLMYDAMIDTHYRFLGCLENDRIGAHTGDDHMSLRSQGQLSDVSCLIARDLFQRYRYRGNYAEDLDLGIRLIKDGWQVAMLASVKTIHSHNRPAYYYLKRSYVDVIFLVGLFDDFAYPHCESLHGLVQGIVSCAAYATDWIAEVRAAGGDATGARLKGWTARWRRESARLRTGGSLALGDARLEQFVAGLAADVGAAPSGDRNAAAEARRFGDAFCDRLDHGARFMAGIYDDGDAVPAEELVAVIGKTFAATTGSLLAFHGLDHRKEGVPGFEHAQRLHAALTQGV
ncbi:glycosyltransferase family 2 protein [Caenimonas aquaedulcis]|uniref:Glycosyltransferase n=1 Tax=Caenimonas aquaedulcis TaxID=2793270 RepID=A0A931H755_9BURK|nr:glycosyltransferase [Caenimonas aquaedulcis]MBG9389773.1 glycosyltransferase [Caenimonas aquaedulcis]